MKRVVLCLANAVLAVVICFGVSFRCRVSASYAPWAPRAHNTAVATYVTDATVFRIAAVGANRPKADRSSQSHENLEMGEQFDAAK